MVIIWLVVIALVLLIPTAYAGLIGAPYAPTLLPAIKKTFDYIGLGPGDALIDLGAGDGKIVREASRRGAQAVGVELSPIMWAVARLRTWRWPHARIRYGNFYKTNLQEATVIFAFLMPKNMPRVRQLLARQSVPRGKYFLAYAFPFKDVIPMHVVKVPRCAPVYVYDLPSLTKS